MISITLPSLSEQAAARAISNIDETAASPCEIIIVSPKYPAGVGQRRSYGSRVLWVEDYALAGANAAHAEGFLHATGDHVLAWVDDHALLPGWDTAALEQLKAFPFGGRPAAVGLRHVTGQIGTCFGFYYPYFPLMRRADVEQVGGWLSGDYRRGFADVDLAMRVWAAGGCCAPTVHSFVEKLPDDDRKLGDLYQDAHTTPGDLALFLERWSTTLGQGWPTARLRDFNIDIGRQS